MEKEEELKNIIKLITWWGAQIKASNCLNFYDINKVAEDLAMILLNEIYDLQLENLNHEKSNYPGIDLGDKKNKIGFQITAQKDSRKIKTSIDKFIKNPDENYSNGIRFLILSLEKMPKLSQDKYKKVCPIFNTKEHIISLNDLIQKIEKIYDTDKEKFYRIKDKLEEELNLIKRQPQNDTTNIQVNNMIKGMEKDLTPFIYTLINKYKLEDLKINQQIEYMPILPILPENISKREKLSNDLLIILKNCTWLAIQGEKGIGKTIMTLLLIKFFEGSYIWISFRDIKKELLCHHLECSFFEFFGKENVKKELNSFFQSMFSKLPKNSILIFDDLPDLLDNYNFSQRLICVINAAKRNDIKIISTSSFNMPENFKFMITQNELKVFDIPTFTSNEISDILNLYRVPSNFADSNFINFISLLTGGHPVLINALIKYLSANSWMPNSIMFENLLNGEFSKNEKREFVTIFSRTVSDELKELIYRLDLVIGGFTEHEVKLVSNIEPRIEKPFEKLYPVFNIWVRNTGNRYTLSPLLKGMGEKNLFPENSNKIYDALAKDIIRRRNLNPIEVSNVILYYSSAKDYNNAAIILINALLALLQAKTDKVDDYGISSIWANIPLPEEIKLDLRLFIRALQLKVNERLNKNIFYLLNDLDRLVPLAGENEKLGLITFIFNVVTLKSMIKISTFCKYFLKVSAIPGIDSFFPSNMPIESAMWLCNFHIKTAEDLLEWVNTVEMMSVKSRNVLFNHFLNRPESFLAMCESTFLSESKNPPKKQNWSKILDILEKIGNKAKSLDNEILWSSSIRTQIIVLAEYLGQFEKAIQLGERSLKIATANPIVQYLLKVVIAKQYLIRGDYKKSDEWYMHAAKHNIDSLHILKLYSLLEHCVAVYNSDLNRALNICEEAVEFANKNVEIISENLLVMALGEYTILKFKKFGVNAAFESLEKGFEILLHTKNKEVLWKSLYMILGHTSGYLVSIATIGTPPEITRSGALYRAPNPGFFVNYNENIHTLYNPEEDFVFYMQLSFFAESIGDDEKAFKWGDKAYSAYKKSSKCIENLIIPTITKIIVPSLIMKNEFSLSISLSHEVHLDMRKKASQENPLIPLGEFLIYQNLIPNMIQMAISKITDKYYYDKLSDIINDFHNVPFDKTQINLNLWESAIKIFEIVFLKKTINQKEIFQNNFTEGERRSLTMLAILGNSIADNILPEQAVQFQANIVPGIEMYYKNCPYLYRQLFIPFFKTYWETKFKQYRFRFRTPSLVEENMDKVFASKSIGIIKNIIKIISDGLGVDLNNSDFFRS